MQVILRRVFGGHKTDSVCVEDSHFVIGRSRECQLCLAGSLVSRRHCEIAIEDGRVTVRDLGSKNGTYVNFHRVEHIRELTTGDVLNVGLAAYEVLISEHAAKQRKHFTHLQRLRHPFVQWTHPIPAAVCT